MGTTTSHDKESFSLSDWALMHGALLIARRVYLQDEKTCSDSDQMRIAAQFRRQADQCAVIAEKISERL